MNRKTYIVLSIASIVVIAAGILFYFHTRSTGAVSDTIVAGTVVASSTLQTRAAPQGAKEYANATYGFSLFYPDTLTVTEYAEAGKGRTISFDSTDGSQGFQIYITPYSDSQITSSRIALDTHGTASTTPSEVVLPDGTHALVFQSAGGPLGTMREVWFLRGGYLYEVTTYLDLDAWLSQIMSTWKSLIV